MNYFLFPKFGDDLLRRARARNTWAIAHAKAAVQCDEIDSVRLSTFGITDVNEFDTRYGGIEGVELVDFSRLRSMCQDSVTHSAFLREVFTILKSQIDLLHTRDPMVALSCGNLNIPYVFEYHDEDYQKDLKKLKAICEDESCKATFFITNDIRKKLGVNYNNVFELPSGYDDEKLTSSEHSGMRRWLEVEAGTKPIVVYSGGLQAERDMEILVRYMRSNRQLYFVIAGGYHADIESLKHKIGDRKNVLFTGHLDAPEYLELISLADICLYTRHKNYISNTSPLKLGDYARSRAVIVSAHLPSFDEKLKNNDSDQTGLVYYEPSSYHSFTRAIDRALNIDRDKNFKRKIFLDRLLISYQDRISRIAQTLNS